jgi:hypothetical protein
MIFTLLIILNRSESGSTFEMWTFNWIISMLKSIENNTVSNVLNACRPVFKRNIKIMIACIPYIVGKLKYIQNQIFFYVLDLGLEISKILEYTKLILYL